MTSKSICAAGHCVPAQLVPLVIRGVLERRKIPADGDKPDTAARGVHTFPAREVCPAGAGAAAETGRSLCVECDARRQS